MITTNLETLRLKSLDFDGTPEELTQLFNCLEFELHNSQNGGDGLSAIQINVPTRVSIIRTKNLKINLYNPEIVKKEQLFVFTGEGCISIPQKFVNTNRYNLIEIKNGDGTTHKFSGYEAVVVQHELDHFDGITILDKRLAKEPEPKEKELVI